MLSAAGYDGHADFKRPLKCGMSDDSKHPCAGSGTKATSLKSGGGEGSMTPTCIGSEEAIGGRMY